MKTNILIFFLAAAVPVYAQVSGPTDLTVGVPDWYLYQAQNSTGSLATWSGAGVTVDQGQNAPASGVGAHGFLRSSVVGTISVGCCLNPNGGCGSMSVVVHPAPPSVVPASRCSNVDIGLVLSATAGEGGNTVRWYDTSTGGTPFTPNGPTGSITAHIITSTTYYVTTYNSTLNLESFPRTPVTAEVITTPASSPSVSGNSVIGPGQPDTLRASTSAQGYAYRWYSPSGSLIHAGQNYIVTAPASTTTNFVYARYSNAGCDGAAAPVTVTVYPKAVITGTHLVMGRAATLSCNEAYDTYKWYVEGSTPAIKTSTNPSDHTFSASTTGRYRVVVTKNGAWGRSDLFTLGNQFDDQNENYIVSNAIKVKSIISESAIPGLTSDENTQTIQYFDGQGRPAQTVATQASPLGYDIVQPVVYDGFGRESRKYLPVVPTTQDGWYKAGIIDTSGHYAGVASTNAYNNGTTDKISDDAKPYAETVFDGSPSNRVLKQGATGSAWQPASGGTYAVPLSTDHSVKKAYAFNLANEVMLLKYNVDTDEVSLDASAYYDANVLQASKTRDEHNREMIEYVDKEGHTILKKVETLENGSTAFAETYYLYDDFGSLVLVLSPEATKRVKTMLIP